MGEIAIKNMIKNIFELLIIILIPLIGLSSGIINYIEVGESVHFVVNTQTYSVDEAMPFHTIIIDSDYIVFNNTGFHITTTKDLGIALDYINDDIWNSNQDEVILIFDVTETTTLASEYTLSGFPSGIEYEIRRNGFHFQNKIADNNGYIAFSTAKIGTNRYKIIQISEQQGNTPPNMPNNPVPQDGSENVGNHPTLYWYGGDPDGDLVTYDIYFGTNPSSPLVVHNQSSNSYNPGELSYSTLYYWRIVAWDTYGESTIGPMWTFTTEDYINHPPTQPNSPNPENNVDNVDVDADLSWYCTDPEGDTITFDIYFGTDSNPALIIGNHQNSYYSLDTLEFSSIYYWKIICYDSYGNTNQSPIWSFTTAQEPNNPPITPSSIIGETNVSCIKEIDYSTVTTDPDNDDLYYTWSWGDNSDLEIYGPYSSGEVCNVSHYWETPGTYQVKVKARDTHYRESSWSEPLIVTAHGLPAIDAGGPYYGFVGEPIEFNGTAYDGFPPYVWFWEFEEGSTSTDENPVYIYESAADYTVTLTVIDSRGYQSLDTTKCHVANTGDLNVIINAVLQGKIFETIQFTGIVEKGTPPYTWNWDFGDGKSSTMKNPPYIYSKNGIYAVNLTVTDSIGLTGSDSVTIEIIDPRDDKYPPTFEITKPTINSLYLNDDKILFWIGILSVGDLTIEIEGYDDSSGIHYIEFYLNDDLEFTDYDYPYEWEWTEATLGRQTVKIVAYDNTGKSSEQEINVWKLF